jgi:hypothetical protein
MNCALVIGTNRSAPKNCANLRLDSKCTAYSLALMAAERLLLVREPAQVAQVTNLEKT